MANYIDIEITMENYGQELPSDPFGFLVSLDKQVKEKEGCPIGYQGEMEFLLSQSNNGRTFC